MPDGDGIKISVDALKGDAAVWRDQAQKLEGLFGCLPKVPRCGETLPPNENQAIAEINDVTDCSIPSWSRRRMSSGRSLIILSMRLRSMRRMSKRSAVI